MFRWIAKFERRSRAVLAALAVGIVGVIGLVDYATGFETSFSIFYLLAIGLAAWFVGRGFAIVVSILSVAVSLAGDLANGAHFSSPFVPAWNSIILLVFYLVVVWLMTILSSLQKALEARVRQRTAALQEEMAERERLEKEILEVGEREQRRIGRDLHDSLCQHLTGTALAGQVLREKLDAGSRPEAADAAKIIELVEEGILMARGMARGIYPVDMEAEGLMNAFRELSASISKWSKVACIFERASPVLIEDAAIATHLYRIAQEAVSNAIRHGNPGRIVISLEVQKGRLILTIEDDGTGLPDGWQKRKGLGTRIMAHRAAMIGGEFSIDLNPTGGTLVKCSCSTTAPGSNSNRTADELSNRPV